MGRGGASSSQQRQTKSATNSSAGRCRGQETGRLERGVRGRGKGARKSIRCLFYSSARRTAALRGRQECCCKRAISGVSFCFLRQVLPPVSQSGRTRARRVSMCVRACVCVCVLERPSHSKQLQRPNKQNKRSADRAINMPADLPACLPVSTSVPLTTGQSASQRPCPSHANRNNVARALHWHVPPQRQRAGRKPFLGCGCCSLSPSLPPSSSFFSSSELRSQDAAVVSAGESCSGQVCNGERNAKV